MKNTRETRMVFSNVKSNKKKAEEKSASKSDEIFDYNNEIVIGLKVIPEPKIPKEKKRKKDIKQDDELDVPFQKQEKKKNKKGRLRVNKKVQKNKSAPIENNQIKPQQHKTKKKKNSKTKKLIFNITKWTTLVLILIGGFIYFLLSPIFNIKNIKISGNEKVSSETIAALSGIGIDENLIKVNKAEVIKNIKQNAYIENVEISKKLSDTIEIKVQERTTTFMIKLGEGYIYINNQGYILEVASEKLDLPIISGQITENDNLIPGNRLNKEDLTKLEMVLRIRDAAQSNELGGLITGIDISDDNNYKIIFENENKVAYIGDCSNLSTRMLYVKAILEQEEGNAGEIFVNIDLNTEYPFFREKV